MLYWEYVGDDDEKDDDQCDDDALPLRNPNFFVLSQVSRALHDGAKKLLLWIVIIVIV